MSDSARYLNHIHALNALIKTMRSKYKNSDGSISSLGQEELIVLEQDLAKAKVAHYAAIEEEKRYWSNIEAGIDDD